MLVGNMVWKIGRRQMDIFEQIRWIENNGFKAVSFHTCNCLNGGEGVDPESITDYDFNRLNTALSNFKIIDIHAPFDNFDINLASPNELIRKASVQSIKPSIVFAAKVKAATVTIHTGKIRKHLPEKVTANLLSESLAQLEAEAKKADVMIGVEVDTPWGYRLIKNLDLPHTGITLDTGHMCFNNNQGWRESGSIGNVIREYHDKLVHMHLHDFDNGRDHLPLGHGEIDFKETVKALCEVGFTGSLCLELSPQYAQEKEIMESKRILENLISEAKN